MANQQNRDVGEQARTSISGRVFTDVPAYAVDSGDAFAALSAVGTQLGARLRGMAADATAREGQLAGLSAGQAAGAGYVAHQTAETGARNQTSDDLISRVEKRLGRKLNVISSVRTPEHNKKVGGAKHSRHLEVNGGDARDIDVAGESEAGRLEILNALSAEGFTGLGVYDNSLHADLGNRRAWGPSYGHESVPAWAKSFTDAHLAAKSGQAKTSQTANVTELSTEPLALRRDGTIYGNAFDDAATRAFTWRQQAGLSRDIGAAYEANKDDPAAFGSAMSAIRDSYLQADNMTDPLMREAFDKAFIEKTTAFSSDVMARQEKRLRLEEISAAEDGLTATRDDLERQAFALGGNGEADKVLAPQIDRAMRAIDRAAATDLISDDQAKKAKNDLGRTIFMARTEGVFESLDTPTAKQNFALQILDDYAAGKGPYGKLGLPQVQALSDELFARAFDEQNKAQAAGKLEVQRLQKLIADDVTSMGQTGKGVDFAASGFDVQAAGALLGNDRIADWQSNRRFARRSWEATAGMEAQSGGDIAARLEMLKPEPGAPGFVQQNEIYQAARERAAAVLKERQTDPLGQAARAEAVAIEPLDTSSIETLEKSLMDRAGAADSVSGLYDTPFQAFRPEERALLTDALMQQPDLLPGFATSVVTAFGPNAQKVMGELSDSGPAIAHAASLGLQTGDNSIATQISRVLADRAAGISKVKLPTDEKFARVASGLIGSALSEAPEVQAAALGVAQLLFERQARLMGFDPADVDKPGSTAATTFQRALDQALGAREVNGVKYGGTAMVNGTATIVPPDMANNALKTMLTRLNDADLEQLPPIKTANGIALGAADLKGARLVAVGDGKYLMALDDPQGPNPRYVPNDQNGLFVLDARELEKVQADRPLVTGPYYWQSGAMMGIY